MSALKSGNRQEAARNRREAIGNRKKSVRDEAWQEKNSFNGSAVQMFNVGFI